MFSEKIDKKYPKGSRLIMQMIMNEGNKQSIYELVYDEETLKSLISEIIKNCSIRRKRKSCIEARNHKELEEKINSAIDFNGNKIYENVRDIKVEPVDDPYGMWRHNDPVPFSFTSDLLISPKLVDFLIKIISGEEIDYKWFASRKELSQKHELRLEILELDLEINQISNFETKRKIEMIKKLDDKVKQFNNIPDFNYELLAKYYDMAKECITLELIQETVTYKKINK